MMGFIWDPYPIIYKTIIPSPYHTRSNFFRQEFWNVERFYDIIEIVKEYLND